MEDRKKQRGEKGNSFAKHPFLDSFSVDDPEFFYFVLEGSHLGFHGYFLVSVDFHFHGERSFRI